MSTSQRRYHPGDVPEQVLRAARTLLDHAPASEISIRRLARTAGVSHAAPYRHFDDRAGFLVALAAHCFTEFVDAQRMAYDAAAPGERLLQVGLAYVAYATDHPHAFALVFDPTVSPAAVPPDALRPLIDAHTTLLIAALEDAIASGRLPSDIAPVDLGAAMWSAAHGLAVLITAGRIPRESATTVLSTLLN